MYQYRHILTRMRQGDSDREIARSKTMGRKKIAQVRELEVARGWLSPDMALPDDAVLASALVRKEPLPSTCISTLEPWRAQIANWYAAGSVHEVNQAIAPLLTRLHEKLFQKLPGSRASTFVEIDAPALLPLPLQCYEMAHFKTVKVHIDYHVEVERHRYSVPQALVGQVLEARITTAVVELMHRGQRVASHARNSRQGGFTTTPTHMPAAHRAHMEWTPTRLIHWGTSIGPATAEAVTRLMAENRHPEHGYRACLGLLSLAKRYGKVRLRPARWPCRSAPASTGM
jgi:hypothetical protein